MTLKYKRWFQRLKQKIGSSVQQKQNRGFTLPTLIPNDGREHTREELEFMGIPVVSDIKAEN
ncbi:TPA: hypothetical protein L3M66_004293 [Vibrio parahaemolyticus]|uniref:hypothetical protein n=1 Tax=Vibrio parahaemolyticus TaxID=670 RepID=UPI003B66ED4B|nr:hypothetical protein [Vibrio parahaemolyticus]HCH1122042.1 hypothetical protein [Vibrio parahaemolyticus]HCH4062450.1 hypothetical protein [Vibrio parahaemolyticus]